jgi:hypothetical protein
MRSECRNFRPLFDPLLDGDLSDQERSGLQRHLEKCAECRSALQKEEEIIAMFENLPELRCPEDVLQKVEEAIPDREKPAAPIRRERSRFHILGRQLVPLGLAAAAVLLILIRILPTRREEPIQITYSNEEVQRARTEALWSLVFVAEVINGVEKDVVEGVLLERLPSTLRKGFQNAT